MTDADLMAHARDERLKRLLGYLASDPANAALRSEAAQRALDCREPAVARAILEPAEGALEPADLNRLGLALIQLGEGGSATRIFEKLVGEGCAEPAIRFNLAWSLALEKDYDRALDSLDDSVTAELGQAAMLEVQLLHQKGEFERAAEVARHQLAQHPGDKGLAAAVSVLALDIEDVDLARACALAAGEHPDALTTLGTLDLGEQKPAAALDRFNAALERNPNVPRAWVGRGLAGLLLGDASNAAGDLDRGADLFGDHIGSWIAAGWAYLIVGDRAKARARFERALAIDDNFAESHGSLAVVDALEGEFEEARRKTAVALRLDRNCFSGGLAQVLLTTRSGKPKTAQALFEKMLTTPINARGDTAAQALARLGLR